MEVDPTELPQEIQFLLEMDFNSLIHSPINKQFYWVRAMKASWKAGRRDRAKEGCMGAREKRCAAKQRTPRAKLRVMGIIAQISRDISFDTKEGQHSRTVAGMEVVNRSNKQLKKPD